MEYYFLICFIIFYISLCGFIGKAGYPFWYGLIPFYNLYLFITLLEISPFILILLALGLIFLDFRMLFATIILIFLPFMTSEVYGHGKFIGLLTLILPFLMYPYLAFFNGTYSYESGRDKYDVL